MTQTPASESDTSGIVLDEGVVEAARALVHHDRRTTLGIVGAPASGKSTLAEALVDSLNRRQANTAQAVPMDGFHLSQRELDRLGRAERKGAPDTFDVAGYRELLRRIRASYAGDEIVYAPGFYRSLEEPIAASIAVVSTTPLVVTEGNYLLLDTPEWQEVATHLDRVWYLHVVTEQREQWLADRHQRFGRSETAAWDWIAASDRPNAQRIEASAGRADRWLVWGGAHIRFAQSHDDLPLG